MFRQSAVNPDDAPRVTVLLPFHKTDDYLLLAVESILQQSFPNFELLLIADSSLQGNLERIHELALHDGRIRVLQSLPVGGLALGLNLGIAAARGEYIARMDADDVSLPGRLETQVAILDMHPDLVALGGRLELMDENGTKLSKEYPFYETDAEIRAVLPLRNPMPHPAMMFRRRALLGIGGYKYAHSAEDWELFLRLARDPAYKLHNLDQVIVRYRRHVGQITRPELASKVFQEVSGFLLSEFLRTGSAKYLAGIAVKVPLVVQLRSRLQRLLDLRKGSQM